MHCYYKHLCEQVDHYHYAYPLIEPLRMHYCELKYIDKHHTKAIMSYRVTHSIKKYS